MRIEDKLIEPYIIDFDGTQYTLGIPKINNKGIENLHNTFYYTSLTNALKKVASLKLGSDNKIVNVEEFIKEYQNLIEEFNNKIVI